MKVKKLRVYSEKQVEITGRAISSVGPHQDIMVRPSPEGNVSQPGTKCEHGNYIPSTSLFADLAPYCSLCYPYELRIK